MPATRFDKHGLPIPPSFDDLPTRDGDISTLPGSRSDLAERRRQALRAFCFVAAVGIAGYVILQTSVWDSICDAISAWHVNKAVHQRMEDDLPGAISSVDRAVRWKPESPLLYELRAQVRFENQDLEGSLADCNKLIAMSPDEPQIYSFRGNVHQRMGKHREAIDDLNRAVEMTGGMDADILNNRAYARALANLEVEEGLQDIEKGLELRPDDPAFLDTRGYLHYLNGDYKLAFADLDRAIEIQQEQNDGRMQSLLFGRLSERARDRIRRLLDQNLAVMHHHRGQVLEKLGDSAAAQADLQLGNALGYNPEMGVY